MLCNMEALFSYSTTNIFKAAALATCRESVFSSCAYKPFTSINSSRPRKPLRCQNCYGSELHKTYTYLSKGCRESSSSAFKKVKQVAYISWDTQGHAEAQIIRDSLATATPDVLFKLGTRKCFLEEARAAGFSEENGTLRDITGSLAGTDLVLLSNAVPSWICSEVVSYMKPNGILVVPEGYLQDVASYVEFPNISVVTLCPAGERPHFGELHEKRGIYNPGVVVYQDADGGAGDVAIGFLTALDSGRKRSSPSHPISGNANEYGSHSLPTCRKRHKLSRTSGDLVPILFMGMITLMNLALVMGIGIRGHSYTWNNYAPSNGTISETHTGHELVQARLSTPNYLENKDHRQDTIALSRNASPDFLMNKTGQMVGMISARRPTDDFGPRPLLLVDMEVLNYFVWKQIYNFLVWYFR